MARDAVTKRAQHSSGTSPLLGREEELDLLLRRWVEAKRGEGRAVLLTGEPGIGKSRIARALRDRLISDPHTPLSYFCSPHRQSSALYPHIGQLNRAAGIERDDGTEVTKSRSGFSPLRNVIEPTAPGFSMCERRRVARSIQG
jgi:AAA ATPase domain